MEGALVSAATGALKPVLGKLAALLGDEYKRFKRVRGEIEHLARELAAMDAFLLKMSEAEDPDAQDRAWTKEVRELSYDIEDSIDEFTARVGDKPARPDGFMGKIKKLLHRTKARRSIAKAIQGLKKQVAEVGERHARYRTEVVSKDDYEAVSKEDHASTEAEIITKIKEYLAGKERCRYFIVVDDIWNLEIWDVIKCAFPIPCCDSKIITTTRKNDVARACCSLFNGHIYNIRPLSMFHAKQLFHRRLFNFEAKCPSELEQVSGQILQKCDGLPLAIIAISGLLANKEKTKDQWGQVNISIGRGLERNSSIQGMIKILSLSYFDLHPDLKTCLLYLSIFPEDHTIEKEDLIRRWIGEGFIHKKVGYTVHESGEMCFNELINRNLIQPVDKMFDEVKSCRVHDTIRDFIITKSVEENFVTLVGVPGINPDPRNKVRRLSLQNDGNIPMGLVLSNAGSLHVFGHNVKIPSLSEFTLLRVLCFEDCGNLEEHHLVDIRNLLHLKYLRLKRERVRKLPKQIAESKCLEPLYISGNNRAMGLPATICRLPQLVYLVVDADTVLPGEIGGMPLLQVLEGFNVYRQSTYFLQQLGELTNLRKLSIRFINYDTGDNWEEKTEDIISSINKLGKANLHSLHIYINKGQDKILESWSPSALRELIMEDVEFRIPSWISKLVNLQKLGLPTYRARRARLEDMMMLEGLPNLRYLHLNPGKSGTLCTELSRPTSIVPRWYGCR